jgi:DNA-binding NtrC family response regulator
VTIVLLVEEQDHLRRQLAWLLEGSGFAVLTACSLSEADPHIPDADVVLVHSGLPPADRELAFRAWRLRRPEIVVIDVAFPGERAPDGVDVHLGLPFTGDWLADHLREMIPEHAA